MCKGISPGTSPGTSQVYIILIVKHQEALMKPCGFIIDAQSFWQLKLLLVGVAINQPNPLAHPCMVTNVYQLPGDNMPISSLVGPPISFR